MTIAKNTNRAKQAIANAKNVLCYSLSNGFTGRPIESDSQFLTKELNSLHSKLSVSEDGRFLLKVHSNLWYQFES